MSKQRPLEVSVLQTRRVQLLQAMGILFAVVGLCVAGARLLTPALLVVLPVSLMVAVAVVLQRAGKPRRVTARGPLGVLDESVTVEGRPLAERRTLLSGAVIPSSPNGPLVRLERRYADLDLAVADVPTGEAVLERLGLDVRHAVARFRVLATSVQRFRRNIFVVIGGTMGLALLVGLASSLGAPWIGALFVPLVLLLTLSTAMPTRVVVGADGIGGRRLFRHWFLSFEGIDTVRLTELPWFNVKLMVVELLDKSGEVRHQLLVDQKKQGPFQEGIHAEVDARAMALAERVREVLELRDGAKNTFDRSSLARGDRSPTAWVTHLRNLRRRQATFRDAGAPSVEALLAVVEDVAAPSVDRAAAAIALSQAEPAVRGRLRVAAEASAEARLRIALESSDEANPEELAATLAALEREPNV